VEYARDMKMSKFIAVNTYETSSATIFYMIPLPKTGCTIAITRAELMQALPDDLIMSCMERGKALRRGKQRKQRERTRQERSKKKLQWIE